MADDYTKKAMEQAARTLRIRNMANRRRLVRPKMRPHTWVFLYQKDNQQEPVVCLGVVFHIWGEEFNKINFSGHHKNCGSIKAEGHFTMLNDNRRGLVVEERWCWECLLGEYRGLSAGDL